MRARTGLLTGELEPARARFFADPSVEEVHRRFRQRNGDRKYLLEAKAVQPFVDSLAPGSEVLDLGAGDNSYLRVLRNLLRREDLRYLGTDISSSERIETPGVGFEQQPSEYETGLRDRSVGAVIMKATAHHIRDLGCMFDEIRRILRPGGIVILIEESSGEERPATRSRLSSMVDHRMTGRFYDMPMEQRLNAMKFLDYYGIRIYRGWSDMPLPLRMLSAGQWIEEVARYGMTVRSKLNMGFANNRHTSCLQRCNLMRNKLQAIFGPAERTERITGTRSPDSSGGGGGAPPDGGD